MLSTLRIQAQDALQDFAPWHRLLRVHATIFLLNFLMFAGAYFLLEWLVEQPSFFNYLHTQLSHYFVIVLFGQFVALIGFHWELFKGVLAAFLFRASSPHNLALMRMLTLGSISGHLLVYAPEKLAQVAALPDSSRVSLPLMGWFIDILPISPEIYSTVAFLGGILCLFAAVGLFTRWSLFLAIPFVFYALGVPNFFGKLNHSHFLLWVPVFMAFSPVGEVWSVDALIKRIRGIAVHREPHHRYGLPMKLIFLQLGFVYFFSGVGKLWSGGLEWALSDNLVYLMQLEWLENYREVPFIRLDQFPILCRFLASGVVAFELGYLFLILTPVTRPLAGVSALFFHTMTGYFLNIDFTFLRFLNIFHLDWYRGLTKLFNNPPTWSRILLAIAAAAWLIYMGLILWFIIFFALVAFLLYRFKPTFALASASLPQPPLSKWVLRTGVGLLAINFCFGLTQESSWPFSTYPSYSFVRTGIVKYIWFKPTTPEGQLLDLNELGQATGFRKENILPMAEQGINLWEQKKYPEFKAHVLNYWLRYREKVPALKASNQTKVIFQVLSTNPDRMNRPLQETEIGHLQFLDGEWKWDLK